MLSEILTIALVLSVLRFVWVFVIRIWLLRKFYEKQGVEFINDCFPIIGNELQVTKLKSSNRTHDWLYSKTSSDLVGTIRGSQIQLYCTSNAATQGLFDMIDKVVRDTPALYSFGRLSPQAIPFTPASDKFFKQRKAALMKGLNNTQRLYDIAAHNTHTLLTHYNAYSGSGVAVDLKQLLSTWTRATSGAFIWGDIATTKVVKIINVKYETEELHLMDALNQIDSELRFHSYKFWNRIYSPLVSLPITKEARRLNHNVSVIRDEIMQMLNQTEDGSVAQVIVKEGLRNGVPLTVIRDDLIIATSAGLDNVKAVILSTIWYLSQQENSHWRQRLIEESEPILSNAENTYPALTQCRLLDAIISEVLRLEPPGSLINNCVTTNFNLDVGSKSFRILEGTRIVPNIHFLHRKSSCWKTSGLILSLETFDPSRFLQNNEAYINSNFYMPFGKGTRRCPGKWQGTLMIKTFIAIFLSKNPDYRIELPNDQTSESTHFNLMSQANLQVFC